VQDSEKKIFRLDRVQLQSSGPHKNDQSFDEEVTLKRVSKPSILVKKLEEVGYICPENLALQISLFLNTNQDKVRALLLEGPSGCGKSFFAKSLAKVTGAEFVTLSCYANMPLSNLIEAPSTLGLAKAMASNGVSDTEIINLGVLSKVFLMSQEKPVILLIDELDKADPAIDTFFLGPIQDAKIWLESRSPISAKIENLLLIFTKNFNRKIDDALMRRVFPIKMSYLDPKLELKILSQYCSPKIVSNLVKLAELTRFAQGSYEFERPPAPEELLTAGQFIEQAIQWGIKDYAVIGEAIFRLLAKSEHDKLVLEHMLKYHPEFADPDEIDPKTISIREVYTKLGLLVLNGVVSNPSLDMKLKA